MFQEQLDNPWKVFRRFHGVHLRLNLEKCPLFQKDVQYFGHTLSLEGVTAVLERLGCTMLAATIGQTWTRDLHQIVLLLPFITGFASIAKLLIQLIEEEWIY
jgi:hypothetical protein